MYLRLFKTAAKCVLDPPKWLCIFGGSDMGTTTFFGESGQVSLSCVPYTFVVVTLMINFLKTCQFTNSTLYYFFGQVFVYMNCTYAKVIRLLIGCACCR